MISEMSQLQYLIAFGDCRTGLSDIAVCRAAESGRMYCARSEDGFTGFLCMVYENHRERIVYAYTRPEYRRHGVFTSLAAHVADAAAKDVDIAILENNPHFAAIKSVCERLGFEEERGTHTFNMYNDPEKWQKLKKKQRLEEGCAWLEKNGYTAVSFADADEAVIRQLMDSHRSAFGSLMDISSYFRPETKNLADRFSFAAVKDGELAAYTLMKQDAPNALIMAYIAASARTKNSGVVMLPLVHSGDCFFGGGAEICSFAIYPDNTESNQIRKLLEKEIPVSEKIIRKFVKAQARALTLGGGESLYSRHKKGRMNRDGILYRRF